MSTTRRLEAQQRDLFERVSQIIFANPFGSGDPSNVDPQQLQALTDSRSGLPADQHPLAAIAPAVDAAIAELDRDGITRLQDIARSDRERVGYAFLFQVYHRHVEAFNQLIHAQLAAGEKPVAAAFGASVIAELEVRGFDRLEQLRYLALFYQVRRAYHFIFVALVGSSDCMQRLRRALWSNVFTSDMRLYGNHLWDRMEDFSTLLLGETGTGKGSAAAAVGKSGLIPFDPETGRFRDSFTAAFNATNLSQFSETLIESELFGHRKGAFTGAVDDHKGLLERCSTHGSLFLDEIGELAVPVQIKLLNVIQERTFSPVGDRRVVRFAGRVIAATNRSLEALREGGRFRDDFFYRLCSDVIEVPPLRERLRESPEELGELVGLLVQRMTGTEQSEIAQTVRRSLESSLPRGYPWPGNVRELEQAVRRVLLRGSYTGIATTEAGSQGADLVDGVREGNLTAHQVLAGYCRRLYRELGSYEAVARRVELDRRTVKKYVTEG